MKKFLIVIFCVFIDVFGISAQNIPAFSKGDRVVFVGNSITCGGHYHSYIWLYPVTTSQRPAMTIN
jgi:hypothetical protein